MVLTLTASRFAVAIVLAWFSRLATSTDLNLQYVLASHPNANPVPSLSSLSFPSNNILLAGSQILSQHDTFFDNDGNDSISSDVAGVNLVSNVQRGGGFASLIPAGYVSESCCLSTGERNCRSPLTQNTNALSRCLCLTTKNPFGYQITDLGLTFLEFDGSLESDVGRFLASVKSRKRFEAIKSQWLEILRVSKTGQSMRIYKSLDDIIKFCINANLLD